MQLVAIYRPTPPWYFTLPPKWSELTAPALLTSPVKPSTTPHLMQSKIRTQCGSPQQCGVLFAYVCVYVCTVHALNEELVNEAGFQG